MAETSKRPWARPTVRAIESLADLTADVFVLCDCEGKCRKDGHAIEARISGAAARCSVWISRRHLAVVAAQTLRRIRREAA